MSLILFALVRVTLLLLGVWLLARYRVFKAQTRVWIIIFAVLIAPLLFVPSLVWNIQLPAIAQGLVSVVTIEETGAVPRDSWTATSGKGAGVERAVLIVLAASLAVGVVSLTLGTRRRMRLVKDSEPQGNESWLVILSDASAEVGLYQVPDWRLSEDCTEVPRAATVGSSLVFCREWSSKQDDESLRQALLHECLHIRNKDQGLLFAFSALTSFLFFHPLVHFLRSSLQQAMEERVHGQLLALEGYEQETYSSLFRSGGTEEQDMATSLSRQQSLVPVSRICATLAATFGALCILGSAPVQFSRADLVSDFVYNAAAGDTVHVFYWNAANGRTSQLTFGDLAYGHPSPSPDRSMIAFVRDVGGNRDVYVLDLDTAIETRLTDHPGRDDLPKFSPDGTMVSYSSKRDDRWQVYVYDLIAGVERRVTDGDFDELESAWHPNGSRLVFSSDRAAEPGGQDIWSCRLDGSQLVQLTYKDAQETGAAYSPDGRRIVFTAHWDFNWDVFVKDLETGEVRRIADLESVDTEAVFLSNDTVAFSTFRSGDAEIMVIRLARRSDQPVLLASGHWSQP